MKEVRFLYALADTLEALGYGNCLCLGEASLSVYIPLKNGEELRMGITDEDVAEKPGLWAYVLEDV